MTSGESEIQVRQGSPADLEEVVRIENRCFQDPWSPSVLAGELIADNLRLPLVAQAGDCLCGYLMAWRVVDQLHLLNLAVDPDCRRQGIARSLLLVAAGMVVAGGLAEATLEVRRSNQGALGFYRKLGFVESGLRPGYYQDNGEDAIILNCSLNKLLED